MNNVSIIGRLTNEPEIRYSNGEKPIAYGSYTLAVDRPTRKEADKVTDFIYCKVLGSNAEFAEKYLHKGMKIGVVGRIQVDQYTDKDGNKRSTAYVQVQNQEFCESKTNISGATPRLEAEQPSPFGQVNSDGFMNIPDDIGEDLPFD